MQPVAVLTLLGIVFAVALAGLAVRTHRRFRRHATDLRLRWPSGWRPVSGAATLLHGAVLGMAASLLLGAAAQAHLERAGAPAIAALAACGLLTSVLTAAVLAFGFPAHRGRVRLRLDRSPATGEPATVLRRAAEQRPLLGAAAALHLLAIVLLQVIASSASALEILLSVLPFALAFLVTAMVLGWSSTELWLTPDHVVLVRRHSSSSLAWPEIWIVQTGEQRVWRGPNRRTITLSARREDGSSGRLALDPKWLHCDPVLLFHCVGFYRRHPQLRDELGTRASTNRVRQRVFG